MHTDSACERERESVCVDKQVEIDTFENDLQNSSFALPSIFFIRLVQTLEVLDKVQTTIGTKDVSFDIHR